MNPESLDIAPSGFPESTILLMPDVLRWGQAAQAGLDTVFDTYVDFISQALGDALTDLKRHDKGLAHQLVSQLQTIPAPDFLRVILAPDFTYRLLWRHPDRIQRVSEYLNRALHVDDTGVLQTGETAHGVKIPGLPPLDLDSPDVTSTEFTPSFSGFHSLSNEVRPLVIDRMVAAWQQISATSTLVADFVAKFVQVIVLRSDEDPGTGFLGGSSPGYIGKVVIGNPHLDSVGDILLADALVHEAIHALLYMQAYKAPWGASTTAFTEDAKVASPWTGKPLTVTVFLQACFVWYGLWHFWSLAHAANTFRGAKEADGRMAFTLAGFVGPPLLDELSNEDRKIVSDDVSSAIETMQARVKACCG
jgi:hypothetical protein